MEGCTESAGSSKLYLFSKLHHKGFHVVDDLLQVRVRVRTSGRVRDRVIGS